MSRESDTWFTLERWRTLEAASRKVLYRETKSHGPRYFTAPDNGMTPHALGLAVGAMTRRGLLYLLPDPTSTGRPVRVTEFGKILRTQWFHVEGRMKPFPFPGLIPSTRHSLERHYLLDRAEKLRPIETAVPNPYLHIAAERLAKVGLLTPAGELTYALTTSGVALLATWRRLPPNLCSCGID